MGIVTYAKRILNSVAPQDGSYNNLGTFELPAAAAMSAPTSGTATWGAWVEIITAASNTEDRIIEQVVLRDATVGENSILQIGTGASGSESARITLPIQAYTALDELVIVLPSPIKIKAGERIAVRASSATNSTAVGVRFTGQTGLSYS